LVGELAATTFSFSATIYFQYSQEKILEKVVDIGLY
jgi:hypothetical protein